MNEGCFGVFDDAPNDGHLAPWHGQRSVFVGVGRQLVQHHAERVGDFGNEQERRTLQPEARCAFGYERRQLFSRQRRQTGAGLIAVRANVVSGGKRQ